MLSFFKTYYQKLCKNWNYYKASNVNGKLLLAKYIFWVVFYRHFICPILALFLLIFYFLLYPFIKFRFIKLIGSALGHYSVTTELLLGELKALREDKFINIFYLEHNLFEPSISNEQLHKMWKRVIFILPLSCSGIFTSLNKLIMLFPSNKSYNLGGIKTRYERRWVRDPFGYLKNHSPFLKFTETEHKTAHQLLKTIGITPTDRFVCLFVRSSAYHKGHPTWHYPERNVELATYLKACHFLAEKGYYVLRMGKVVDDWMQSSHPRIIDYARSSIRSDFMDIYISAHCHFFITTGSGLDGIPQIFRKPILYTNCFILHYIASWYPHYLFTFKNWANKTTNKLLSFKDQIELFQRSEFLNRKGFHVTDYVEENNLTLIDNTEDELFEVVQEMEARLANNWNETNEAMSLQVKFWEILSTHVKQIHEDQNKILHRDIFIKLGTQFLYRYQNLL